MRLPAATRTALRGLYRVESAAKGPQVRRAREASSRLFKSLVDAGWTPGVVARGGGWPKSTMQYRVAHQPTLTRPLGVSTPDPPPPERPRERWTGEPGWLRPAQAAALLGVHVDTVTRWREAGLLPHTRKGPSGDAHEFSREGSGRSSRDASRANVPAAAGVD